MSREDYIQSCKDALADMPAGKVLVEYIRGPYSTDRTSRRSHPKSGVVVAYKDKEQIHIGFASCHSKKDKFNKYIGLALAMKRAKPEVNLDEAYFVARPYIEHMITRANNYFNKPNLEKHKL